MTANTIEFTSVFQNLHQANVSLPLNPNPVPGNLLQTLSAGNIQSSEIISGTLFVPRQPDQPDCPANIDTLLPPTVIQRSLSFPANASEPLVAFAPWVGSNSMCNLELIALANQPNVIAYISYLIDGSAGQPPDPSSNSWSLPRNNNPLSIQFPIYVVPSQVGLAAMDALSHFANATNSSTTTTTTPQNSSTPAPGNSSAPGNSTAHSHAFLARAPALNGNSWILASIAVSAPVSGIPGLWVIVLCVVGVFLLALLLISLVTRIVQRRRRFDLRRRILSGETDFSILGVKKVTVPESILNTFPIQRYQNVDATSSSAPASSGPFASKSKDKPPTALKYAQASCAICIDDYTEESTVRVLPCGHIFHPECVDAFLRENSSLCPLCKRTVLPKGYCPADITNAMVRRDRALRIGHGSPMEHIDPASGRRAGGASTQDDVHWSDILGVFGRRLRSQRRRPDQAVNDVELQPTTPAAPAAPAAPVAPATSAAAATPADESQSPTIESNQANTAPTESRPHSRHRLEWARRRAVEMVDDHPDGLEEEEQRQAARPAWRKVLSKAFGGM